MKPALHHIVAENLQRAELTELERDEHIAEWIRLTEEKQVENREAQVAPLEIGYKKPPPQPAGGINAASRELGIERTQAQRAVRIAGLAPEAKAEARKLGLDDNQSAPSRCRSTAARSRSLREIGRLLGLARVDVMT